MNTPEIIQSIQTHYTMYKHLLKNRIRIKNALSAFIVRTLWPEQSESEKERERRFTYAKKVIDKEMKKFQARQRGHHYHKQSERHSPSLDGGGVDGGHDRRSKSNLLSPTIDHTLPPGLRAMILVELPIIYHYRSQIDDHEAQMKKLAGRLPIADWWCGIKGCDLGGLSKIIAESGNLAGYSSVKKLYKRFGLLPWRTEHGVISASGLRRMKRCPLTDEDWGRLGYAPSRRAVLWNVGHAMRMHQVCTVKDEGGEVIGRDPTGPYGVVLLNRKRDVLERNPEMIKAHADADAQRIMEKALLRDLYQKWNAAVMSVAA